MSERAEAFWTIGPGQGEIRSHTLPRASPDDVMVRSLFSGISRGTESLVFHGRVPSTEYQRMRAPFQEGDFPAPVKYGYSSVGVVEQGPAALVGHTVFALFPHQTRYVVPAGAVHVVPASVPARRAVLTANLESALNGIWDAGVQPGDRVAVVGGGTVGCLVAWLAAQIVGCEVELVDVNPVRSRAAAALGVPFATPETARDSADVVMHASGSEEGLAVALRLAGDESVITELSWYGDQPVRVALGGAFHAKRLTLRSSQVGRVPAERRQRWTTTRRVELSLSLLADPQLDALLTGECAFANLPATMQRLSNEPGDTLCHTVIYS